MTPGTRIAGRYRVVRRLGRGGMGEVLEVLDEVLDRPRALKIMHAHVDHPDARARFELEARVGSRIDSPYLVDVIDTGVDVDSGRLYLVMELLVGESLGERVARLGPRPPAEVVDHLGQLALALARMHARGVVHRDLKPTNLFLHARAGEPAKLKVLDLGVAKLIGPDAAHTTGVAGTPAFMAPEQLRGRDIGPATDLYALGLIAFALLAGRSYWTEAALDPIAFALIAVRGPTEPASARAELPASFDAWFARATAAAPTRRWGSAIAAVRALAEALAIEPAPALRDAIDEPVGVPDAAEPAGPVLEPVGGTAAATGASETAARVGAAATELVAHAGVGSTARRGGTRPRFAVLAALAMIAMIAAASWWTMRRAPDLDEAAVVACPVLAVEDAEDGWLGAAAAAMICERARAIRGGLPARIRVPAELLALSGVQDPDADPYAAGDARARSLAAARAHLYIDGAVSREAAGFHVELMVRRPGRTVGEARGSGQAASLQAAVRAAMQPMLAAGLLGPDAPDPVIADYARAGDATTLLGLADLTLELAANAGDLDRACAWLDAAPTDLAPFLRYVCRYQLGEPTPSVAPPLAASPGGLTAWARVEHMVGRDHPAAIAALKLRYAAAASSWARSSIAATLSCLVFASAPRDALAWAWSAVEAEPKNTGGEWCSAWGQLMAVADDTSSQRRAAAQWQAWTPWESYAWWYAARLARSPERALVFARRAYALAPFDTNIAGDLADRLLRAGQGSDAGQIARRLSTSPHPVHAIERDLVMVRFDASEARFGAALTTARRAMRGQPGDAGWARPQRLALAWLAVELANVVGQAGEVADEAVAQLVGDRLGFDGSAEEERRQIAAICAYASPALAARCFTRLEAAGGLRGGTTDEIRAFTAGARRYAAQDLAGAAGAWRPLVRDAHASLAMLPDAMVAAFAAAGDPELALQIAERTAVDAPLFGGATLALARGALVAEARGDRVTALRLAARVVEAWRAADVLPPIVGELRAMQHRNTRVTEVQPATPAPKLHRRP